jgi:hypothetical protein
MTVRLIEAGQAVSTRHRRSSISRCPASLTSEYATDCDMVLGELDGGGDAPTGTTADPRVNRGWRWPVPDAMGGGMEW